MNFYNNEHRLYILKFVLLIGFLILAAVNLYNVFIKKDTDSYWGIVGNLLLAVSMALQIRKYNKVKNSDNL